MLGVLPVRSLGVLLTLYGNKFERESVVGPLKLYFFLKLVFIKGQENLRRTHWENPQHSSFKNAVQKIAIQLLKWVHVKKKHIFCIFKSQFLKNVIRNNLFSAIQFKITHFVYEIAISNLTFKKFLFSILKSLPLNLCGSIDLIIDFFFLKKKKSYMVEGQKKNMVDL